MLAWRAMRRPHARVFGTTAGVALAAAALAVACAFGVDVDALDRCSGAGAVPGCEASGDAEALPPDAAAALDGGAACPTGRGPAMARVGAAGDGACVDRTEVSVDDYAAFLAAGAFVPEAGARACAGRATFVPASWPPPPGRGASPVTGVDYCEAEAFCAWAGKALCGARGGGPLDARRVGEPAVDLWTFACGGEAPAAFPYGPAYVPRACNGVDREAGAPWPVGSQAACANDETAPRDLSGNVWEWTAACERDGTDDDPCWVRGGAFNAPAAELGCTARRLEARGRGDETVGFRCCAP